MLQSNVYLNQQSKKFLHFKLAGQEVSLGISTTDYYLSEIQPVKVDKFWVYKSKVYLNNPLEAKTTDEVLKDFDIFVDRPENKLDTEPNSWEEYIGQTAYKETMQETLKAVLQDGNISYPHILISGSPGYGKSALIHLLAKESNLPLIETISGNLQKPEDIYSLLARLSKKPPYSILFIDELHSITKEIAELLLPALQMFKVANQAIPYFTFAGATTDLGLLTKKLAPLVDRCQQVFVLNPYTNEELGKIVLNIALKRNININNEALLEIADRARQTPRLALNHLFSVYYAVKARGISIIKKENVEQKLNSLGIYKSGITKQDIILLEYLNSSAKPVGQSAISQKLNVDGETYLYTIEPILIRQGYINRTARGRILDAKGKDYINECT